MCLPPAAYYLVWPYLWTRVKMVMCSPPTAYYIVWFYLWFWVKIIMCLSLTVHNIIRNFTLSGQAFDIDINQACNLQEIRTLCTSSKNMPFLAQEGHVLRARRACSELLLRPFCNREGCGEKSWRDFSLTEHTDLTELFGAQFRTHRTPPAYRIHRGLSTNISCNVLCYRLT